MDRRGLADSQDWPDENSGSSGEHLVDLMRRCDGVLEVMLILAERSGIVAVQSFAEVRNELAETVGMIDAGMADGKVTQ